MSRREEKSLQSRVSEKAKLIETRKKARNRNNEEGERRKRKREKKEEKDLLIVKKIVSQCVEWNGNKIIHLIGTVFFSCRTFC